MPLISSWVPPSRRFTVITWPTSALSTIGHRAGFADGSSVIWETRRYGWLLVDRIQLARSPIVVPLDR